MFSKRGGDNIGRGMCGSDPLRSLCPHALKQVLILGLLYPWAHIVENFRQRCTGTLVLLPVTSDFAFVFVAQLDLCRSSTVFFHLVFAETSPRVTRIFCWRELIRTFRSNFCCVHPPSPSSTASPSECSTMVGDMLVLLSSEMEGRISFVLAVSTHSSRVLRDTSELGLFCFLLSRRHCGSRQARLPLGAVPCSRRG